MTLSELYKIFQQHPQVTTDSRNCPKGSIFFALKGESFNGNLFAEKALASGCSYAIVDQEDCIPAEDNRYILTDDCLTTLQQLANYHRRQLGTRIIGITGTNGKTTTKELMAAVLSQKFNVLYTEGNLNNHIGVPKTLLRLTRKHDMAVIEMGANHPGEIKMLAEMAEPDFGIITNVGKAHLEGFGSFEGVIRTKGELYDYLRSKPQSVAFIHHENSYLTTMANGLKTVYYGTSNDAGIAVSGHIASCSPLLCFNWHAANEDIQTVQTHLIGSYNLPNMLAAACIGHYFGVPTEFINRALTDYIPSNNRSQLEQTPFNHLIVDTYNANPTSMRAALQNFLDMEVDNKMVILGEMKELGDASEEEHARVVQFLDEAHFDNVWLVGDAFLHIDSPYRKFQTVEEVKEAIACKRPEGFYILIKGSNATKLFQLPPLL